MSDIESVALVVLLLDMFRVLCGCAVLEDDVRLWNDERTKKMKTIKFAKRSFACRNEAT